MDPPRRSKRERDVSSVSYIVESLPDEGLQSDYQEERQEPSGSRTSKRSRRDISRGYAKDQPCQGCFANMINNGPENICCSQAKAGTVACYRCARRNRSCQQLPLHLLDHGARLQAAARRITNDQPVENWDELVTAAGKAMKSDVAAKPEVTPRAQISKVPALTSAHAFPQVQLLPSRQSPPKQGPPEVQGLSQPAAASQSPSDTISQQILAELKQSNALSEKTNQSLQEIVRQQQEARETSREKIRCLRRIIGEMNAFN